MPDITSHENKRQAWFEQFARLMQSYRHYGILPGEIWAIFEKQAPVLEGEQWQQHLKRCRANRRVIRAVKGYKPMTSHTVFNVKSCLYCADFKKRCEPDIDFYGEPCSKYKETRSL